MTLEEFENLLESAGFPVAYDHFPEDEPQQLPFICYLFRYSDNFYADGAVYVMVSRIRVELYTETKDLAAEQQVEAALSVFCWKKEETYLSDEQCYEIIYEIEV